MLKYQGSDRGANITLGLSFIRTSVDHDTALEFMSHRQADVSSFTTTLNLVIRMIVDTSE